MPKTKWTTRNGSAGLESDEALLRDFELGEKSDAQRIAAQLMSGLSTHQRTKELLLATLQGKEGGVSFGMAVNRRKVEKNVKWVLDQIKKNAEEQGIDEDVLKEELIDLLEFELIQNSFHEKAATILRPNHGQNVERALQEANGGLLFNELDYDPKLKAQVMEILDQLVDQEQGIQSIRKDPRFSPEAKKLALKILNRGMATELLNRHEAQQEK